MEHQVNRVWVVSDSLVSPLGSSTADNFNQVVKGISGIDRIKMSSGDVSIVAGRIPSLISSNNFTRFEQLCINCLDRLNGIDQIDPARTIFIFSTTKGNIDLLRDDPSHPRLSLHATAAHIGNHFGFKNILVVSNACISGVMAIAVAKRYITSGQYDHAVVLGADELTSFVVNGFISLGALSDEVCKPFDANRKGINLGEAAAALLLSNDSSLASDADVEVLGAGLSNDANHISGPSRTGEELAMGIKTAIASSNIEGEEIDFISAHGTATIYNDEMEAKAFALCGLSQTPLHSLKAFYGHTLGAAGVVESVIGIHSLRDELLIPSLGFQELGVSCPLNVIDKPENKKINTFLKTASGFGGCNAAIVFQKHN